MAASALRNRNSMRTREAFEAYVARGVEPSKDKNEVDISYVEKSLEAAKIKIDKKKKSNQILDSINENMENPTLSKDGPSSLLN